MYSLLAELGSKHSCVLSLRMSSIVLYAVLLISGAVVACRAWGPLPFVNSPMNAESIFALAGVLLLVHKSSGQGDARRSIRPSFEGALLILLTAAAFYRTIDLYFLSDDFLLLKHARSAWQNPLAQFTTGGGDGFYRPIGYLALGLTQLWAGIDPLRWHIAGLILHAANALLVWLLASRLGLSRIAASITAALFILHGTRPESVVWLAGRFDLLATAFVLAGLLAFLRGWHAAALLLMTLGILSKESAYAFPLLLLLFERRRLRILAPYFAVAAALFATRLLLFHGIGGYSGGAISLLPALKALLLRLWAVLFFPIDWAWPAGPVLSILTAAYIAALAWMFSARVPRSRLAIALGFAVVAALPPVQQLLIGPDMQKSRLLYLPSIGFCLLAGIAIEHLNSRARLIVATTMIAFQFAALWHNADAWRYASGKAKEICTAAAITSTAPSVPASLNGVYFFANGFPECVEFERAKLK